VVKGATVSKFPEWAWKVLSMLVLPLIAWGIKLEVDSAVYAERSTQVQAAQAEHKSKIEALQLTVEVQKVALERVREDRSDLKDLQKAIEANGKELVGLRGQLIVAIEEIGKLKNALLK